MQPARLRHGDEVIRASNAVQAPRRRWKVVDRDDIRARVDVVLMNLDHPNWIIRSCIQFGQMSSALLRNALHHVASGDALGGMCN